MLAHAKFQADSGQLDALKTLLVEHSTILSEPWEVEAPPKGKENLGHTLHPMRIDESVSTRFDGTLADLDVLGMLVLAKLQRAHS